MVGDTAASIIGAPSSAAPSRTSSAMLDESDLTRLGNDLIVPPAEEARLRLDRVSDGEQDREDCSVARGVELSSDSRIELMTAGFAGFALTRLGERLLSRGAS